jgi:hypothetical protein
MEKDVPNLDCPCPPTKVTFGTAWGSGAARSKIQAESLAEADAKKNSEAKGDAAAQGYACPSKADVDCTLKHRTDITGMKSFGWRVAQDSDPTDTFLALAVADYDLFVWCQEIPDAIRGILEGFKKIGEPKK